MSDSNDNIFTQYMEKRNILIKNRNILQTSYIPGKLPHRKNEIDQIVEIIAPSLNKDLPSNILIIGKTGTGKTAVMNYIGKQLKMADPDQKNCMFIYVNCEVVDTPYTILYNITNQVVSVDDPNQSESKKIPFTGWSLEKIFTELSKYIDERNMVFIIVLDEIDRTFQRNGDDIFYYLTTINEILEKSRVSIIGITNNARFTDELTTRVKSRLGEEKIIFPPYNASQLQDILRDRAEEAFENVNEVMDDDVIPYCAALSAQDIGDARRALDLLRMSADIAERNKDPRITVAHVRSAKNKLEFDAVAEIVKTLTTQSKLVLISIVKLIEERKKENNNSPLTTGEVYTAYKFYSSAISTSTVSQRRVASLISELDMLGIIHARVKSFGKAGRTKEIELSTSREIISLLSTDPIFIEIDHIKPSKQMTFD